MTVRTTVILASVFLPIAGIGCSPPESPKFVEGTATKKLAEPAAAEVTRVVNSYFGTPHHLVATLELPVRFGELQGKVVEAPEGTELKPHQVYVEWLGDADVPAGSLTDLGLVWTSGAYQDAEYEAVRRDRKAGIEQGDVLAADFRVLDFTPTEGVAGQGILSLNFKLEKPAEAGAEFKVIGHRLRQGRKLYMQHCMHCHGFSGDGAGPTAEYLNPLPRDYRLGIFKFTSTRRPDKPSRADLTRIIKEGIPGTYMPSFLLMDDDELAMIIEYVRWLSMRGEFEMILANGMEYTKEEWKRIAANANSDYQSALKRWNERKRGPKPKYEDFTAEGRFQAYVEEEFPEQINSAMTILTKNWSEIENAETSGKTVIRPTMKRPAADAESIARGRALYLSNVTNCWTCHGVTGKGDGPQTRAYQKNLKDPAGGEYPEPGLYNDWGHPIQPRDLTRGIYRGGRRPIDLYRRIKVGIKGTPMPSFGALKDEQIWDIVNYVLSVPVRDEHSGPSGTRASSKKMAAH